ncbi:hypothetical protein PR202_gb25692 [Eleusine coracana subsp. coracana]|uniref:Syntaxin 6/10/61 N-terminal domain-containing protein n=1 Tax=Eleusine coracana subsp. coracana TaxID=191504 RepID=A0AAV5FR98_ELECO|nr:hypothetical protein PR202_gb25692 [Eleusine coracana subsp. coracana]
MAAPGGLEQWQKDGFFQAAEEVQESADLMESIYRTWMRERTNSSSSEELIDLQRELQTALGTAKWQLEQFGRAVGSSNDKYSLEEGTIARRQQFIVAIEDQISCVEKSLSGSFVDSGRQRLNWVKLDDEERDDLVTFLSAPAQFYSEVMSTDNNSHISSRQMNVPIHTNDHRDMTMVIKDIHEVSPREISSNKSEVCCLAEQLHGHKTNLNLGDDHWKIDIGKAEMDDNKKMSPNRIDTLSQTTTLLGTRKSTESLTRVRWFSLWKPKSDEHRPSTYDLSNHLNFRSIYLLAQKFNRLTDRSRSYLSSWNDNQRNSGRTGGLQIQGQQQNIQFGHSIRITLLLMLSIFLIGQCQTCLVLF